jgi:tRNA(Ile)-lysidine synthase
MHGQSKKVADVLADAQVPAADRAAVPILRTSPSGQVVWIAGIRADERARAHVDTHVLLELTLVR